MATLTLFRPVGPKELALIEASGWRAFPPRLPEQPIFYPVTNEEYAIQIARDWNVKSDGLGFVTRFEVDAEYAARFPKKIVGNRVHEELWVPAEELAEFNSKIVGKIEVTRSFSEKKCLTRRQSQRHRLSRLVLTHESRQPASWLIFDVRQNVASHSKSCRGCANFS